MLKQILTRIFGNRSVFKFTVVLVLIIAVFLMVNLLFIMNKTAETMGSGLGITTGTVKGVTTGWKQGVEDGEDAGKYADDYELELANEMEQLGKLEVLIANTSVRNDFTIGTQYEVLYIYKGSAIFTVELSQVKVSVDDGNKIMIKAPMPCMEFVIDDDETKKVMEMQNGYFTGSREGGYEAYIYHRNEMLDKVDEYMVGYEELCEEAKKAAICQLTSLTQAVCGGEVEVQIEFL